MPMLRTGTEYWNLDEQFDGPKRWIGRFLMEHLLTTARSSVTLCQNRMHTAESIRKLLGAGLLEPANVSAAAALGNEPSLDACDGPMVLDSHYRTGVEQVCSLLEHHQCLELANSIATRALVIWQNYCTNDQRPEKVLRHAVNGSLTMLQMIFDYCQSWPQTHPANLTILN